MKGKRSRIGSDVQYYHAIPLPNSTQSTECGIADNFSHVEIFDKCNR